MIGFNNAKAKLSAFKITDAKITKLFEYDKVKAKSIADGESIFSFNYNGMTFNLKVIGNRYVLEEESGLFFKAVPSYTTAIECLVHEAKKIA